MKNRRDGGERIRERVRTQRRCDVPAVSERIADEPGALTIVPVLRFAERRRARRNRALESGVDILHEHVKCHRPDWHDVTSTRSPFTNHYHRVADTHLAVHATATSLAAESFLGIENLRQEIDESRPSYSDVRRDRGEPFANDCWRRHRL